jgi:two-component system sensor histidine kinase CpxA
VKELLDLALSNVVRNAVRYAGQSGPIEITAREEGDRVEIQVRDHGPGVRPESLAKIFEPFYRPEAARDRRTGGAGLGLAIVKRSAELWGGAAKAELPPDGGLRVVLSLPADLNGAHNSLSTT